MPTPIPSYYITAGQLFRNAVDMSDDLHPPMSVAARRDAMASILFSSVATEAFINELSHSAQVLADRPETPDWTKTLGAVLDTAEESRSSLVTKYQLAMFIISGASFARGGAPFQDFSLLVEVRNLIAHKKPLNALLAKDAKGKFAWMEPKTMVRLQSAGAVIVDDSLIDVASRASAEMVIADLVGQLSTATTAVWACRAAAGIVNSVLDAVRERGGLLSMHLEIAYRKDFANLPQERTHTRST